MDKPNSSKEAKASDSGPAAPSRAAEPSPSPVPKRRLQVTAALVVVLIVLGGLYSLHLKRQLRDTRARELRVLGKAADHVTAILENSIRNLEKLKDDPSTVENFIQRQPYLNVLGKPDLRVIADNYRASKGTLVAVREEDSFLSASIQNLQKQEAIETKQRTLDLEASDENPGRLEGTRFTTLSREGDTLVLHNIRETRLLELRAEAETDPAFLEADLFPVKASFVDSSTSTLEVEVDGLQLGKKIELGKRPDRSMQPPRKILIAANSDGSMTLVATEEKEIMLESSQLSEVRRFAAETDRRWRVRSCGIWIFNLDAPVVKLSHEQKSMLGDSQEFSAVVFKVKKGLLGRKALWAKGLPKLRVEKDQRPLIRDMQEATLAEAFCLVPVSHAADLPEVPLTTQQVEQFGEYLNRDIEVKSISPASLTVKWPDVELRPLDNQELLTRLGEEKFELQATLESSGDKTWLILGPAEPVLFRATLETNETHWESPTRLLAEREDRADRSFFIDLGGGEKLEFSLHIEESALLPKARFTVLGGTPSETTFASRQPDLSFRGQSDDRRVRLGGIRVESRSEDTDLPAAESLTFKFEFGRILSSLPLSDAFQSYIVASAKKGEVFHQHWLGEQAGVRLLRLPTPKASSEQNLQAGALPFRTSFSPKTLSASEKSLGLFSGGFEMTCQPIRISSQSNDAGATQAAPQLVLCGLTDRAESLIRSLGMAPQFAAALLILAVLIILSLPLFKLILMSQRERLRRQDVLLLMICTFALVTLATSLTAVTHQYLHSREKLDSGLEELTKQIQDSLQLGFHEGLEQLAVLDKQLSIQCRRMGCDRPPKSALLFEKILGRQLVVEGQSTRERSHFNGDAIDEITLDSFTTAFWVNSDGWQFAKATIRDWNTAVVDVSEREYFRAVRDGRLWRPPENSPADTGFAFQTFASMTTGVRSSALSMESDLGKRGDDGDSSIGPVVAVLTGIGLPRLSFSPVVTPPYRFAVLDADGLVQYHSDPRRASYENILDEVSEPRRLRAVMASGQQLPLTTKYIGRPHSIRVKKLNEWPLWIVALYDHELAWTLLVDTTVIALSLTALYGVAVLIVVLPFHRKLLRFFRPSKENTPAYLLLGCVYLAAAALILTVPLLPHSSLSFVLACTTMLPIAVILLTFKMLSGGPPARMAPRVRDLGDRPLPFHSGIPTSYFVAIVLFWVVIAVVPALLFTRTGWFLSDVAALHYQRSSIEQQSGARSRAIKDEFKPVELEKVPNFVQDRISQVDDVFVLIPDEPELDNQAKSESKWLQDSVVARMARRLPIYNEASRAIRYAHIPPPSETHTNPAAEEDTPVLLAESELDRDQVQAGDQESGLAPNAQEQNGQNRSDGSHLETGHVLVLAFLLGCLLALLGLWIRFVSDRLFFLRARRLEGMDWESALKLARSGNYIVETCSPGEWANSLDKKEYLIINLASKDNSSGREIPRTDRQTVYVGFEEGLEQQDSRVWMLEFLESLVGADRKSVILLTRINPFTALGIRPEQVGDTLEAAPSTETDEGLSENERVRWAHLLSDFSLLVTTVRGPQQTAGDEERESYWGCVWTGLSPNERLVLMQLAEDGSINPNQVDAVETTAQRALIELTPLPEYRYPDFRDFVSRARRSRSQEEWNRATAKGDWRRYRLVFLIVVVAILAFLFASERELFNNVIAAAAALAGGVAAILRLTSTLRVGLPSSGSGRASRI